MRTPDARPVGEMRDAEREAENEVLHLALRLANWDPPSVMDLKDAPLLEEHARALAAYRDACNAEARAALLAGAPTVWVATDDRGDSWCCTAATPADADGIGEWLPLEGPLTQPGTVRRYALVPHPEGEATPT